MGKGHISKKVIQSEQKENACAGPHGDLALGFT